jgi:hypothetical protein
MQPPYPLQNGSKQFSGHCHLSQLKDNLPGMAYHPTAYFNELQLNTSQRPVLDGLGQA